MTGIEEHLAPAEAQVASMNAFYESDDYRALPAENKAIFDNDRNNALQHLNMMRRRLDVARSALG